MSHWIMGILAGVFAMLGLAMASAARDDGVLLFGFALFVGGVLFAWWMIKTAYDEAEGGA